MDTAASLDFVDHVWEADILPALTDYIRIPNKSPHFDPDWQRHGHMDEAVALIANWCERHAPRSLSLEVVRLPGRTPLIYMEVPGEGSQTVLLYGHLDKQPEMSGWIEGLGPWTPVRRDDRLYGRGGADDGYAAFASLTAIRALQEQGLPHARCVIIIEACEESGSFDLPYYIDALAERIGTPGLIVCLDSGCGNYEQLWCTTSLRGMVSGTLRVDVLKEGVHSGDAGGIVPSSFRIARDLLGRLEDAGSGRILPDSLHAPIPEPRRQQAELAAQVLGEAVHSKFPYTSGTRPMADSLAEAVLSRTWRPALAVTGADGLPAIENAGNVLRPYTALKLSLRLPPTLDGDEATTALKALLERNPPYGAKVSFIPDQSASGWNAPALSDWLARSIDTASRGCFGRPAMYMGEGGSIPFMAMLGERFPRAQFMITGVLGPQSNAHGPNEFLHIPTGKRLTAAVAQVLADHHRATA